MFVKCFPTHETHSKIFNPKFPSFAFPKILSLQATQKKTKNEGLYSTQTQTKLRHDLELVHSAVLNLIHKSCMISPLLQRGKM